MEVNMVGVHWLWRFFDGLSPDELYHILALRQRVFIVEQSCPYLDADGLDRVAWHLLGYGVDNRLIAYLRLLAPGVRYADPSIGRVVTDPSVRRHGVGRKLMDEGIRKATQLYPGQCIRISAQRYLQRFYASFGFVGVGDPYEEDGIAHVEMVLEPG